MELGGLLDLARSLGGSGVALGWSLISSALTWGLLALAVGVILFFLGLRLRWVDPGRRVLWVRVVWGLLVFLIVVPAVTSIGVVATLRSKVSEVILTQAREHAVSRRIGSVLLLPLVFAHGSTALEAELARPAAAPDPGAASKNESGGVPAALARTLGREGRRALWGRLRAGVAATEESVAGGGADVGFLLEGRGRSDAVRGLTDRLAWRALNETPVGRRLQEQPVGRVVASFLLHLASDQVADRVAFYDRLTGELRAGPDGKLTWAQATAQAGERFLGQTLLPLVKKPFDGMLIKLGVAAVLPPLLLIIVVQIVRARSGGRTAGEGRATANAA